MAFAQLTYRESLRDIDRCGTPARSVWMISCSRPPLLTHARRERLQEEVRFARDSPLEQAGLAPSTWQLQIDGKRDRLSEARRYARLCRHGDAGDLGPGGEGLGAAGPEVGGGVVVSVAEENVGELVMSGKEALNVPRRLEPLHDPLSSSGRLMGVFGPVIEALVLTMLDPGHDLPLGSGVALQLVGDEDTGGSTLVLEELAEQAFGGLLVAPALDENIENEALLVDGTPEPMLSSRRS
jgi:hypothetical protein